VRYPNNDARRYESSAFADSSRVSCRPAELGIPAPTSRLNDAIAVACFGKTYAAVVATEGAGALPAVPTRPPHITEAAHKYDINPHVLGQALHLGIHSRGILAGGGVLEAVVWLAARYGTQLDKLAASNLVGLADEPVMRAVFNNERWATWQMAFAEWVVAEASIAVNGRSIRCIELLRE
jgi:hypothetical protein